MKTLFEIHKQLRQEFKNYKEINKVDFRHFLTDILNYTSNEADIILKDNKRILYQK